MKRFLLPLFLVLLISPFSALAETASAPVSSFDQYLGRVDKKFDKGAINTVMGWSELIAEPLENFQKTDGKKRWLHAAGGIGTGAVYGVLDTAFGFFNAFTSLIPAAEVPLPEGGVETAKVTGADAEAVLAARNKPVRKTSPAY